MKISSPAFKNGGVIPFKYSCEGDNVNPEIDMEEIPEKAQSLALIIDDPDAPSGVWTHWILYNIPADIKKLKKIVFPENREYLLPNRKNISAPVRQEMRPIAIFSVFMH